ncbi:DUF3823 domain-containing protein [Algoriphagus machipongonensis]|uniref:DUF3823 domain-containing protein n=1 Tax=Algoriphagus machipongonensis TaxID=388413 RepID=A3I1I8_9BACT|nr:DUF3823 domain-containing protein [Algoriphagus machipongonensis]EAZ79654.2 hypothetical protein ALPR1_08518 [Algoriphagus machipongonensis]
MKLKYIKAYMILLIGLMAAGCEFDNFEEPKSTLSGRIVYNGEALGLRSNGVELELWQPGFDLYQKIPVYVAQDGTFSAVIFDGDYKMNLIRGNGPWMDRTDSIDVQVRGSQIIDVEVQPYYVVNNASVSPSGNSLSVTFTVDGVNTNRDLEFAGVYMGRTSITDIVRNEGSFNVPADQIEIGIPITVEVPIPGGLAGRGDIFVRVGAKTSGVAELVYTQVENIPL